MVVYQAKKFKTKSQEAAWRSSFTGKYMKFVEKHSFIAFGAPFMLLVAGGWLALAQFAQVRFEQHDAKQKTLSEEEGLSVSKQRRKVDLKEDYYRLLNLGNKDWEQKRVPRLEGESENVW